MKAVTIYWDEKGGTHHVLISEVNEKSGSHISLSSEIRLNSDYNLDRAIKWYQERVGPAYVKAYLVTEYKS